VACRQTKYEQKLCILGTKIVHSRDRQGSVQEALHKNKHRY